jgi:hypothetical protein
MKMKREGFIIFLLWFGLVSYGQQFGGFPPSTKWKQVETDTARIIFTKGSESQAERITSIIHRVAADTSFDLGSRLKRINIVLHNRSTISNAYVALGPFRSEFYLIPGSSIFDFGNLPWQENLAIHEYRHVHQYNNFRKGWSKVFSILLGQQGQAFANALSVPDWFFEGDAVFAETVFSKQGRGRLPYFLSGYNSLWAEDKNYSWMKLRNGSYKDYVPNHYQLGYLLTNYGYEKYGPDFWRKVTSDASAFKGIFYPFQRAVKKYSGENYSTFRNHALASYQDKIKKVSPVKDEGTVTNYFYPQFISKDTIVFLRSAYNKLASFFISTPKGEKKIALQNISSEEWFSYRSGKIAYTSFSTHARWNLVNYNDIVLVDIHNGKQTRITEKQRYYTPDISPSSKNIIAVRINDSSLTELDLVDINTGKIENILPSSENEYYINPRFVDEDHIVVAVRDVASKISLRLLDLRNKKWEEIIPASEKTIGLPQVSNKMISFVSNINGNDDLYVYNLENKKIFQITQDQTGNYFPAIYGDSIAWSHFTSNGMLLKKAGLKEMDWKEVQAQDWLKGRSSMEPAFTKNIFPLKNERFGQKRYPKAKGLFNFHSWIPEYTNPDLWKNGFFNANSDEEVSVSVYSDNVLNNFSNQFFYRYNNIESSHGLGWNTYYGGLFPVISGGVEYTFNRTFPFRNNTNLDLDQLETRIGMNIPLNLTQGKYYKFLNPGSNLVYNRVVPTGLYKDSFQAENTTYLHHFISWSNYLPMARQHINPKFGWSTLSQFRHLLNDKGWQAVANGYLYLPSFGNHSIVIQGMYQETDTNSVAFSNRFNMSRGYTDYYFSRMWKVSGNYHLPLLYPDFGFANIAYLLRVRGNLFYDLSRVYSRDKSISRDFRSIGTEIFFDTKWWNQLPVSFGFRISRLLDDGLRQGEGKGSTYFEFILPVGLIPN